MFACLHLHDLADIHQARLLDLAGVFSPRVEAAAPDAVVLDLEGLERLWGSPGELAEAIERRARDSGFPVRVAVAGNPEAAVSAARGFPGVTVIPEGEEAARLAVLPIGILSPPPELAETLARWGIRSFGELAALPEAGLSERLGPEGVVLRKRARGAGDRLLAPAAAAPVFRERLDLEHPVALLESFSFLLARLLGDVCASLESRGLAAVELRLGLELEDRSQQERSLRLPFPMRSPPALLKLLQLDLETHPPGGAVTAVTLSAEPAAPRLLQQELFVPPAPAPEKLEWTLARLARLAGEGQVGAAEVLDTHRPGAFRMKRLESIDAARRGSLPKPDGPQRLALRVFRPPLEAKVEASVGRPSRILARGLGGEVTASAGPWRSSGEWWTADPWTRDEWDVALGDGALYRIWRDRRKGGWFVEGRYD